MTLKATDVQFTARQKIKPISEIELDFYVFSKN